MYMTDARAELQRPMSAWPLSSRQQPDFAIPKKTPLAIEITFYLPSNRLNVNDWDGLIKLFQDAIFETGGGNDAWVREAVIYKFGPNESMPHGELIYSEVKLSILPKEVTI
jgi:hypothetical protein